MTKLNINIDHVATLRQARLGFEPDPISVVNLIIKTKVDGIVMHLREDRRHIQYEDLVRFKKKYKFHLNLEMAPTLEMVKIANKIKPNTVTLVPEKRRELTTEGGLNIKKNLKLIKRIVNLLSSEINIMVFIDPLKYQIKIAKDMNLHGIEINTGKYATSNGNKLKSEFERIRKAAIFAESIDLYVSAGHGLTTKNLAKLVKIEEIKEYNIGHSVISDSIFFGIKESIQNFQDIIKK
jgi:pyridoxine 5-phosphate synthase